MKFSPSVVNNLLLLAVSIIVLWVLLWQKVYGYTIDGFEKSIHSVLSLVQVIAIIFGGWLAHKKFIIERKIDEAIKVKAVLMAYERKHSLEAADYRNHRDISKYKVRMISAYSKLFNTVHLSILPGKLRESIFEVMVIPILTTEENVDTDWNDFGKKLEKVMKQLDNIILY